MASRKTKRPPTTRLALRWLGVGALCFVAFLYYKPARTYFAARHTLDGRAAEVRVLVAASASDAALTREARRIGLVRPGEQLFIVKGIERWQKRHPATLGGHG
jgi:hypothetical protein